MFWSLSFQLLPDENIIDDSTQRSNPAIKPAYSVFLTNKRAIFRFDGLGSTLTQSFFYDEITAVKSCKRLFIDYLEVKTKKKDFLLNTAEAEYWAGRILEYKKGLPVNENSPKSPVLCSTERKKRELLDMLTILRKNSLLSDTELEEKIHLLDSMKF